MQLAGRRIEEIRNVVVEVSRAISGHNNVEDTLQCTEGGTALAMLISSRTAHAHDLHQNVQVKPTSNTHLSDSIIIRAGGVRIAKLK